MAKENQVQEEVEGEPLTEAAELEAAEKLSKTPGFADFVKSVGSSIKDISKAARERYGSRGVKRAILALGLFARVFSATNAFAQENVEKRPAASENKIMSQEQIRYEGKDEDLKEAAAAYNRALWDVKFVLGQPAFMEEFKDNINEWSGGLNVRNEAIRTAKVLENSSIPDLIRFSAAEAKSEISSNPERAYYLKGDAQKELVAYGNLIRLFGESVDPVILTEEGKRLLGDKFVYYAHN